MPELDFNTGTRAQVALRIGMQLKSLACTKHRQTFVCRNGFGKLNCMKALWGGGWKGTRKQDKANASPDYT
jgi:hypothetical protein